MPKPTVTNINEAALSAEERNGLAILRNLPVEKFDRLKELMKLGTPGVIGPQTLAAFLEFCKQHGFDLSQAGVNAFKEARRLGNSGTLRGVIGSQTAEVYYDEIIKQALGEGESLLDKVLSITGAFEGKGFTNLTGDFDRQGISFGILQWNFGQGSLPPVLKRMQERDPARFSAIFGPDLDRFLGVLNSDRSAQVQFARSINDQSKKVIEPWRTYFTRLGEHPPFQDVQREFAGHRLSQAKKLARDYGLKTERAVALMFDIVVQNGGIRQSTRSKILNEKKEKEKSLGRPLTERELMEIIAFKRAEDSNPRWRSDVLARKLCIVRGTGEVHGKQFDLANQYDLTDALWA